MKKALNHQDPGRIPIDFGATMVTGIHCTCIAALRDYYGLAKKLNMCCNGSIPEIEILIDNNI